MYTPNDHGVSWLIENEEKLQLRKVPKNIDKSTAPEAEDDDIPF